MPGRKIITCRSCDELRLHGGRGLCKPCWKRHDRHGDLYRFPRGRVLSSEEHYAALDMTDPDACWPWPGPLNDAGYGIAGRHQGAHRWVYERLVGPIPTGKVLDHDCHNRTDCGLGDRCPHRACVNPSHMIVTTRAGNNRSAPRATRNACGKGHEYTAANTYRAPGDGARKCRTCGRTYRRARKRNARLLRSTHGGGVAP